MVSLVRMHMVSLVRMVSLVKMVFLVRGVYSKVYLIRSKCKQLRYPPMIACGCAVNSLGAEGIYISERKKFVPNKKG